MNRFTQMYLGRYHMSIEGIYAGDYGIVIPHIEGTVYSSGALVLWQVNRVYLCIKSSPLPAEEPNHMLLLGSFTISRLPIGTGLPNLDAAMLAAHRDEYKEQNKKGTLGYSQGYTAG